ncbi:SPOR domain-containing protein [Azotobacter vinelandii]|uniref:SPOR domain-containing protein n=1 Tax=Azotobacter vinelandii TaxID=354 RepID=UPI0026668BA8|nr:SPOR domain-containing protein [Azotobacter vinelandii]WKN22610.1 SPOR domain-containing protein [Azotobacter vinelandii]
MRWLFLLLVVLNFSYWVLSERLAFREGDESAASSSRDAGPGIQLLSESEIAVRLSGGRSGKDECLFLWGGLSEERGRQIVQRLLSLDIASGLERFERIVAEDYLVYLPPLASRHAALQRLKELQARKIDSYVIAQGDLTNGISLGVFSRAEPAGAAVRRFREAGYEPAMRELPQVRQDYWVRVAPKGARLFDEHLMDSLVQSFPRLRQLKKECEGVASPVRLE